METRTMIKNDREYRTVERAAREMAGRIAENADELRKSMPPGMIEIALLSQRRLHEELREELREYEDLTRGRIRTDFTLTDIGSYLVRLRIWKQLTQARLAELLKVDNSQVSRDENSGYWGLSLGRLLGVLSALEVDIRCTFSPAVIDPVHIGELGRSVARVRKAQEITQEELARRLGLRSKSQISRNEKSEYVGMSLQRLLAVLSALGIDVYCELIVDDSTATAMTERSATGP